MTIDLPENYLWLAPVFFFLYAEIHFRIPGLYSRYYKKEPEIIADVPFRLDPGQPLPVLILIKDAHMFPVRLLHISADISRNGQKYELLNEQPGKLLVEKPLWSKLYFIRLPEEIDGRVRMDVAITFEINGKVKTIHNDNYALTSHSPFEILIDQYPLPKKEKWYLGDLHYHSIYSSDQVEFGAPLDVSKQIAKAMGIDFFAVTDHSYDLDDLPDNYLQNDPLLSKWIDMLDSTAALNKEDKSFIIIPGEEMSVGNEKKQNVHFLLLNNRDFFHGSGDGAEKWFRTKPEWLIRQILPKLEPTALAVAAHPETKPPLLQKLLINRGKWRNKDYMAEGLHGVQMWNGIKSHFLQHGIQKWVSLLLKGKKLSLLAGNDAHGNFNRFRQLGTPFLTMRENKNDVFTTVRTGVYIEKEFSLNSLIEAIRKGGTIVTDGPFAEISIKNNNGKICKMGDTFTDNAGTLQVTVLSSPTFGFIKSVELYAGDVDRGEETIVFCLTPETGCYEYFNEQEINRLPGNGYIRLMAISENQENTYHCFTNPVYIKQDEDFYMT
ncbi:PHP domain-containing protein [candidate division KSB1 bacterium]|nr:PHP domain-containing protein [candidate division KSB1 bacterium]